MNVVQYIHCFWTFKKAFDTVSLITFVKILFFNFSAEAIKWMKSMHDRKQSKYFNNI